MDNIVKCIKLMEPFQIGNIRLPNRIVMPPMVTNYATQDGFVTDRLINYYERRARGGVGLIIVEATCVDYPIGKTTRYQLGIDQDKFIPGLKELIDVVHKYGVKVAIQLHHAGSAAKRDNTGMQPVAPSPVTLHLPGCEIPKELTVAEINTLVSAFAIAAGRAKRAGFDGLEIHAAHDYLISQFLSLAWNKRSDSYGGDLKNRARFLVEIIRSIRDIVGKNYPLWCRINGREYGVKDGFTLDEAQQLAVILEQEEIAALNISGYGYSTPRSVPIMSMQSGAMLPLAEAIKKRVRIPVMAVGKISPEIGETALQELKADLICIGRGLITDPELPAKVAARKIKEIVPCMGCGNCGECIELSLPLNCTMNTACGRETEFSIVPQAESKNILVIGGGPAGMEAARIARSRGHHVELWESQSCLGGQLLVAAVPPHKSGIQILTNHLVSQIEKLGVIIRFHKKAIADDILINKPDVVIIATGSSALMPNIPGIDNSKVVLAQQVLGKYCEIGEKVVIIGGELVGLETAELLVGQGKEVTVVRRGSQMGSKMTPVNRELLLLRIEAKGINMLPGVEYDHISDVGLHITTKDREKKTLEADTIVIAAGAQSNNELIEALQGKIPEVYAIGDCVQPRRIIEAVQEATTVALKI